MLAPCMDAAAVDAAVDRLKKPRPTPPNSQGTAASWMTGPPRASRKRMPGISAAPRFIRGAHPERFLHPGLSDEVQRHPLIRGAAKRLRRRISLGMRRLFLRCRILRHEREREISQIPEGARSASSGV